MNSSSCRIAYRDLASVHLGYPVGFRLQLSAWFAGVVYMNIFLRACFEMETNLNLQILTHILW
jgi:hypothetical protein